MTRADLRTLLKRRLGNRFDVDDTVADVYLNNGLLDLATVRVTLRSLERACQPVSTTAGVVQYSIEANAFVVLFVEDTTNKRVLTRFAGGFYEFLQYRQSAQNDKPSQFVEFGTNFYINPPDGAYSLTPYCYMRPTFNTAASAVPDIETEWHYAVLLIAAQHAFRDFGDDERAAGTEQEFQAWVAKRDTAKRATDRFNVPQRGVMPAQAWMPGRLGV